jgi:DNA invertase Pin-like site-specific DNA recombinase
MTGIIYARVSSIGERQNTERQIEDLTKYAENNGIDLVKVFSEKISGAKKNNERAILMECFEYAETNKIDVILVSECSRVGRAIWEVLESVKYCVDRHVDIFFQKENLHIFDANGEVNPFMAVYISCLGMCAQIERQNIMFRLNSGRQLAIQRGVKMGRKVGSTKTQEQKQAEYKDIIKLLRKGYSVASTYAIGKERGIKCSISTIKRVKKEFLK